MQLLCGAHGHKSRVPIGRHRTGPSRKAGNLGPAFDPHPTSWSAPSGHESTVHECRQAYAAGAAAVSWHSVSVAISTSIALANIAMDRRGASAACIQLPVFVCTDAVSVTAVKKFSRAKITRVSSG